jgi:hypothetical protein
MSAAAENFERRDSCHRKWPSLGRSWPGWIPARLSWRHAQSHLNGGPGHLRDRLARLAEQPDRALRESAWNFLRAFAIAVLLEAMCLHPS